MALHTAAISSSAWKVTTPCVFIPASRCSIGEAGVIGYDPRKSLRFANVAPANRPQAVASVPVTVR